MYCILFAHPSTFIDINCEDIASHRIANHLLVEGSKLYEYLVYIVETATICVFSLTMPTINCNVHNCRIYCTGGNVVRGNRTVMQMKSLRDHLDMSYGSNKQWNQLYE